MPSIEELKNDLKMESAKRKTKPKPSKKPGTTKKVVKKVKKVAQTKANKTPIVEVPKGMNKPGEFETYAMWKSLPAILRKKTEAELEDMGFDPLVVDLLKIKNQIEFAKEFKVNPATLTEWNEKVYLSKEFNSGRVAWAKRLTSGLLLALHEKALKEGDAPRIKLYYQIVESWIEKSKTESEEAEAIREMAKTMRAFAERK